MLPAWSSSPFYLSMLPMMHCSSEAKAAAARGRVCKEGRRFGKQTGLLAFPLLGWMFCFVLFPAESNAGAPLHPPTPALPRQQLLRLKALWPHWKPPLCSPGWHWEEEAGAGVGHCAPSAFPQGSKGRTSLLGRETPRSPAFNTQTACPAGCASRTQTAQVREDTCALCPLATRAWGAQGPILELASALSSLYPIRVSVQRHIPKHSEYQVTGSWLQTGCKIYDHFRMV